jgi:hypothetical protein
MGNGSATVEMVSGWRWCWGCGSWAGVDGAMCQVSLTATGRGRWIPAVGSTERDYMTGNI